MEEDRIYELINDERKERITAISEIHARLDDIFSAVNKINKSGNGNSNASWVRQSVGLTIGVIALIGFMVPTMVSIVKPMQQQINYIRDDVSLYKIKNTEERTQFITLYDKTHEVAQERINARFMKLEEWQRYMYREVVPHYGELGGRVSGLEKEIDRVNELFKIRNDNIKKLSE